MRTPEKIAGQLSGNYANYIKQKRMEDVGHFLQNYVVDGGGVAQDPTYNNRIVAEEIVVSLNGDVMRRDGQWFMTKFPLTTWYLDFHKDGDWNWSTSHPSGTVGTDYLTIATVTTNGLGNVAAITDTRGHVGGFRLKDYYGLEGYATVEEMEETVIDTQYISLRIDQTRKNLSQQTYNSKVPSVPARHYNYLQSLTTSQLNGAKRMSTDGSSTELWYPDGDGYYGYIWTRDVAMMIDSRLDYFTANQILGVYNYIATRVNLSTFEVPDHIAQNGTVYWTPGLDNDWGSRAPVDGNAFLVDIAWQHYRKTGIPFIFESHKDFLKDLLELGIPYNPVTGCVQISDASPFVGFGFMDVVKPTGDVLFPSVLAYNAYNQMADMAYAAKDFDVALWALDRAATVQQGVQATLWHYATPSSGDYTGLVGFFKAASLKCSGQDDLWGSALAVWTGLASEEQAYAISKNFASNYSDGDAGFHQSGGIRHVLKSQDYAPGTNVWEAYFNPYTYGEYQNGGFWPTPLPWVCYALSLFKPDYAKALMDAALLKIKGDSPNGPYEWWNGAGKGAAKYVTSATHPYMIVSKDFAGWSQKVTTGATTIPTGTTTDITITFPDSYDSEVLQVTAQIITTTGVALHFFAVRIGTINLGSVLLHLNNDGAATEYGAVIEVTVVGR
ncbi:hypothetical protein D3C72_245130 [compost metagenome]